MANYLLKLKGTVGGADFDSSYTDYILTRHKGQEVHVLINSLGGSLATALAIVASFREHDNVHVHFVGMNASAATIVAMGAKRVTMDANAMFLVHQCSTEFFRWTSLNATEAQQQIEHLEQLKSDLEKFDANVANLYAAKTGKSISEISALMKVGGWLTAQEAHNLGFVDEITNQSEDKAPVLTEATVNAMAAASMPIPKLPIIKDQNSFQQFFQAMAAFFSGSHEPQSTSATTEPASAKNTEENGVNTEQQATNPLNNNSMKNHYPLVLAAITATIPNADLTLGSDGSVTLTAEHLAAINAAIESANANLEAANTAKATADAAAASAQETITSLNARIAELEKQPGDSTSHVHNSAGTNGNITAEEQFAKDMAAARELFNSLP